MAKSLAKSFKEHLDKLIHHFNTAENVFLDENESGISLTELRVIKFIGNNKSCIMRQISEQLFIPKNNLTAIIDKLEKKNIVERNRSETDRRLIYVSLTANGKNIFDDELRNKLDVSKKLLKSLTKEERRLLFELLEKITEE